MDKALPAADLYASRPVGMAIDLRHARLDLASLVKVNLVDTYLILLVVRLRRNNSAIRLFECGRRQCLIVLIDALPYVRRR